MKSKHMTVSQLRTLKSGDKVIVRRIEDLKAEFGENFRDVESLDWVSGMDTYSGEELTVYYRNSYDNCVRVRENQYSWRPGTLYRLDDVSIYPDVEETKSLWEQMVFKTSGEKANEK